VPTPPFRQADLDPSQLADVAEAAFVLGLVGLAQVVLDAAYDCGTGAPVQNLSRVFAEIRGACIGMKATGRLTRSQIQLLQITNIE